MKEKLWPLQVSATFFILLFCFIAHQLFSRHEGPTPPPTKIIATTLKQVDQKVLKFADHVLFIFRMVVYTVV